MQNLILLKFLLIYPFIAISTTGCADEQNETSTKRGDSYFEVTGDVTISIDEANAQLIKLGGKIPAMTIVSAPSEIRKHGKSYSVNLFFSNNFEPKPGIYPVAFSYRIKTNTLGGSFGQRGGTFSIDTKGTVEFIEFGEQVRVRFEFEVFNESEGHEGRQGVTVKGEAVATYADIF